MDIAELERMTTAELQSIAKQLSVPYSNLRKRDLIIQILKGETEKKGCCSSAEFWK